jgi:hypothetical protein
VVVKKVPQRAQMKRRTWSAPRYSIIQRMRMARARHARLHARAYR